MYRSVSVGRVSVAFCRLPCNLIIGFGHGFVEELRQDAEESQQQLQQFRREVGLFQRSSGKIGHVVLCNLGGVDVCCVASTDSMDCMHKFLRCSFEMIELLVSS